MGLKLDYERIRATGPGIVEMLRAKRFYNDGPVLIESGTAI